jgi:hypothetical protein
MRTQTQLGENMSLTQEEQKSIIHYQLLGKGSLAGEKLRIGFTTTGY